MANSKKEKQGELLIILMVLFFTVCALYLYISGCINFYERNRLEALGAKVEVTVTDMELTHDDSERYTMRYTYNGKEYTYKDTSDHKLYVGNTYYEYVDPENPEKIILVSDHLHLSFIMLLFVIFPMYLTKKFIFIKRHLFALILIISGIMFITGCLLSSVGTIIYGIITLLLALIFRKQIKKSEARYLNSKNAIQMNFEEFKNKYFNGDTDAALKALAHEGVTRDYKLTTCGETLNSILDSLDEDLANKYMEYYTEE